MAEPTGKHHTIRTIAELVDIVTLENVEGISRDLKNLLVMIAGVKGMSELHSKPGEDPIKVESFDWIDDDLSTATVAVHSPVTKKEVFQLIAKPSERPGTE